MSVVSESIIKRIKRNFQIIFAEQVSDEFEEECQKSFLKFIDILYNVSLCVFAFMALGTVYFSITRVIL